MADIEQFKKNIDEIKESLKSLKENVSLSDTDKKIKLRQ